MARPSSRATSTSRTSPADTPSCSRRSPRVPNIALVKDCGAIAQRLGQLVVVVAGEGRQVAHVVADDAQLGVGHVAIGRRDENHRVDEGGLVVDHGSIPSVTAGGHVREAATPSQAPPSQALPRRNAAVRSIASLRPTRSGTTPAGKGPCSREGKAGASATKTPQSLGRAASPPTNGLWGRPGHTAAKPWPP